MRGIDQKFIDDLKTGCLSYFLNQVKNQNKKLCLEIRDRYVNIYYKGGNLLRIKKAKNGYKFHFDASYCLHKSDETNYDLLSSLNPDSAQDHIDNFELMMTEMDSWFAVHPKSEREFQHNLLANNPCIIDIEYEPPKSRITGTKLKMRLDMLMVNGDKLTIVENKFGVEAMAGSAGIKKHYDDICKLLSHDELYEELLRSVINIAKAKHDLGLLQTPISVIDKSKTEILFLFADFNEKSKKLDNEMNSIKITYPVRQLKMNSKDHIIDLSKAIPIP